MSAFVFIYIPGGSFIFNISRGQRPVPDLDQRVGDLPQLALAGIFHPLPERHVFVVRSHQGVAILWGSTDRGTPQAEPR